MADTRPLPIPTGGRDDLRIDASRCLRMRFSACGCRRCADACPHAAVTLEGVLSINADRCTGCLICTVVCASGALEPNGDFAAGLAQLSRVPEPVLGCIRTREKAHATMTCLGGLSEEHLVTLSRSLSGKLSLNLTACGDCPNRAMIAPLQQRVDELSEAGLLDGSCQIALVRSPQDMHYHDEGVGRRSFFKSLRNSLFQSAAMVLSPPNGESERHAAYVGKRVPIRRELLNSIRQDVSQELAARMEKRFDWSVSFDASCTGCQGCVAICPTGALQTVRSDLPPAFDQLLCTGCELCREFCLDEALHISK